MADEPAADGPALPDDVALVRVTDEFDESTVPRGLRRAHRVARGVWGVLVVREGSLRFVWEESTAARVVVAGERQVIPPDTPHRVEVVGAVRFVVEFHRPMSTVTP